MRSGRFGGTGSNTPGRPKLSRLPSGGLMRSGRFGGTGRKTPGRPKFSCTPSGGLTRSGRFGGTHGSQIHACSRSQSNRRWVQIQA